MTGRASRLHILVVRQSQPTNRIRAGRARRIKWWRAGRWTRESAVPIRGFSAWPTWFRSPVDFPNIIVRLRSHGFGDADVAKVAGGNWLRLFRESFVAQSQSQHLQRNPQQAQ